MSSPILPGTWRAMAAGWHPNPPGSSTHPNPPGSSNDPNPPGSSNNPNPPGSSNDPHPPGSTNDPHPPWMKPAGVGLPDAQGGDSWLLAEALRTSRNRILRPAQPGGAAAQQAARAARTQPRNALWRWQRPYREAAVLSELTGLFVVHGQQLWWMPTVADLQAGKPPASLFELQVPAAAFNWDVQIDKVLRAAVERDDRMAEILVQRYDFSPFFDALTGVDQYATQRLLELLTVAANLSTHVVMALKNTAAVWRPVQRSALVQPMIETPGHGSLPSGHATVAAMNASLLSALLYAPGDPRIQQLDRLARRIAFNRVVAGVHFPIDSLAGYQLGRQLAQGLLAAAGERKLPAEQKFLAKDESAQLKENDNAPAEVGAAKGTPAASARRAPLFSLLWEATVEELELLRI